MRIARGTVARRLADLVMGVLLLAGIAKLSDLGGFSSALLTWKLIPAALRPWITVGLPLAELAVAGVWFLKLAPLLAARAAAGLLLTFSALFIAHLILAKPPTCGCFGLWLDYKSARNESTMLLVRNAVLVVGLVPALCWLRAPVAPASVTAPAPGAATLGRPGFTLIETLVSIALIGVLVSLSLPALAGVRQGARRVVSLSNLRAHAGVFAAYANEYRDCFPYLSDPRATYTVRRHPVWGSIRVVYFEGMNSWHWPLLESHYDGNASGKGFEAPDDRAFPFTTYFYASTLIARPEFWNEYTRTGPEQWTAVRQGDVTFPSAKGVLVRYPSEPVDPRDWGTPRHRKEVAFADGRASAYLYSELRRGYPQGEGSWPGSWWRSGVPVMHTRDGARGRDVE